MISKTKKTNRKKTLIQSFRHDAMPVFLIPHAGEAYAGYARKKAFLSMSLKRRKLVKRIHYISAVHSWRKKIDHSYYWVRDELLRYFPHAAHIVYSPQSWQESERIAKKLAKTKDLVIGTTDLMHYGPHYKYTDNLSLSLAQRRKWKVNMEKVFLKTITDVNSQEMRDEYENNPHLACGPYSIYCLLRYMELQDTKRKGSIKAYYDSLNTKYVINKKRFSDSKNFVSYVSVKFI